MSNQSTRATSKYLSFILRHNPEAGGITLDKEGWASVDEIIKGSKKQITREQIEAAVRDNDKKRFELHEDHIRASQGHSVPVDIKMDAYVPQGPVYHGTVEKNVKSILKDGLQPRNRIHVHLSKDVETATSVGKRHGAPILLEIDARRMRADGIPLMESKNGVVLAKEVPPRYIKRLEE
ncbi:MAG: RNA 2'-phosphotransferase [bacterium]|nr:RNA 2'-phosphotransferase [bacterium]